MCACVIRIFFVRDFVRDCDHLVSKHKKKVLCELYLNFVWTTTLNCQIIFEKKN